MSPGDEASIVTAIATIITALIAAYAATTWKSGLKQSSDDKCVAAVSNCAAAIGRVLSLKQNVPGSQLGSPITDAWIAWSSFVTSYEVAKNYRSKILADDVYQKGSSILHKMEALCHQTSPITQSQSENLNKEFDALAGVIKSRFR